MQFPKNYTSINSGGIPVQSYYYFPHERADMMRRKEVLDSSGEFYTQLMTDHRSGQICLSWCKITEFHNQAIVEQ